MKNEEYAQRVGEKQVNWFDFRLVEILTCYVLYFNCFCHYLCPYSVKFSLLLLCLKWKKTELSCCGFSGASARAESYSYRKCSLRGRRKKRRGRGRGDREREKGKDPSLSPQSPSPFSLLPYPLPLSTPATQAIENGNRTYRCQETFYDVSVHRPYRLWG